MTSVFTKYALPNEAKFTVVSNLEIQNTCFVTPSSLSQMGQHK
jgi:hypothetical protein